MRFGAVSRPNSKAVPDSNAIQVTNTFTYQSYFDSTLLQKALLEQAINSPIVASTAREEGIPGWGLAVTPNSQCPVAVIFRTGNQVMAGTQAVILKPGEVIFPAAEPFVGFRWGLPFGWLGGGTATVQVLRDPSAIVGWGGNNEVIFHRATYNIVADNGTLPAVVNNWPTRFPWPQAVRGSGSINQGGSPQLSVEPTRVLMRLLVNNLAAGTSMRMIWRGTLDFDQGSSGAITSTDPSFVDVTWPAVTVSPEGSAVSAPAYPLVQLVGEAARLGCEGDGTNNGGLLLMDNGNAALTNQKVQITRYGRL